MADKTYKINFEMTDGSTQSVEFVVPQGDKGEKGDTGATGPQGEQGIQGIQGEPGAKGDKGDKGDAGEPGATGATGQNGVSTTHSWNGTVLTVTSASGTSSADLKGAKGDKGDKGDTGAQGEQGPKGDTGATGPAGAAGKTPVKGVDYWTEADKEAIVQEVITALGTPVFGTVDAENNIILTGNLVNGTYTLKYENADGAQVEIGTVKIGTAYTNMITKAEALDSTALYNGSGYKNGYYASSATPYENTDAKCVLTGLIPYNGSYGATELPSIYIKGATLDTSQSHVRMQVWKEDKTYINGIALTTNVTIETLDTNYYKVTFASNIRDSFGAFGFIRMSLIGTGDNLIITIGEPIE